MREHAIRALRRRHGWTQAELAERLGTDHVTVSRWERGVVHPRPSAKKRLGELAVAVPRNVSGLVRVVGEVEAERLLRRSLLLAHRPPRHRFAANPARRLREVDRRREEQAALKASMRA
jgi:transcriptional regulator with XRE-family HTH domain